MMSATNSYSLQTETVSLASPLPSQYYVRNPPTDPRWWNPPPTDPHWNPPPTDAHWNAPPTDPHWSPPPTDPRWNPPPTDPHWNPPPTDAHWNPPPTDPRWNPPPPPIDSGYIRPYGPVYFQSVDTGDTFQYQPILQGCNALYPKCPPVTRVPKGCCGAFWKWSSLKDIPAGKIVKIATDKYSFKFLMQHLTQSVFEDDRWILEELMLHLPRVMCNTVGNYVIQKLISLDDKDTNSQMSHILAANMKHYISDPFALRIVQKLLDGDSVLDYNSKVKMFEGIAGDIVNISMRDNCVYVLFNFIRCLQAPHLQQMINSLRNEIDVVACDKVGCRVLQRLITVLAEQIPTPRLQLDEVIESIIGSSHLVTMMRNQYGNYLVQECIKHGTDKQMRTLFDIGVRRNVMSLSQDKSASNVIERVIERFSSNECTKALVDKMCLEVLRSPLDSTGQSGVSTLVKDMYANYVLQNMIKNCSPKRRFELVTETLKYKSDVLRFRYGRALMENLEAYLRQMQIL